MKMKFLLAYVLIACVASFAFAQTVKEEKIKVYGNCGMCKKRIEKAATTAGASFASWNEDTKVLIVKFDESKTTAQKIEQQVAGVGHDTQNLKATDETYNKLPECCLYDRKEPKKG